MLLILALRILLLIICRSVQITNLIFWLDDQARFNVLWRQHLTEKVRRLYLKTHLEIEQEQEIGVCQNSQEFYFSGKIQFKNTIIKGLKDFCLKQYLFRLKKFTPGSHCNIAFLANSFPTILSFLRISQSAFIFHCHFCHFSENTICNRIHLRNRAKNLTR